jgi:hypothetical protein
MQLISHRGNINGKDLGRENIPKAIEEVIDHGFHCEVDLWLENKKLFLGHDRPETQINFDWLLSNSDNLWIHCKNFDVLNYLSSEPNNLNFFWHENDDYTLTSKNYIWTYPDKHFFENSVLVYLESDFKISENQKIYGICTDYPKAYSSVE